MQAMKGATGLLGSMNRQMNLPALQRIAMEFERENDIMDQRQVMMDDAIDDVTGLEDEEEGEEVVNQVLDEIGVDLNQAVSCDFHIAKAVANSIATARRDACGSAKDCSGGRPGGTSHWGRSWRGRSSSQIGQSEAMSEAAGISHGYCFYDGFTFERTALRAAGSFHLLTRISTEQLASFCVGLLHFLPVYNSVLGVNFTRVHTKPRSVYDIDRHRAGHWLIELD